MTTWFGSLGAPVAAAERDQVKAYLDGLGIHDELPVQDVSGWDEAREVVTHSGWDRRWWDAEQLEKRRLQAKASALRGEAEVLALSSRAFLTGDSLRQAAAEAAARYGCDDAGMVGCAAGAASEALHLAELAELAGEATTHPFRAKQSLFAAGRWPLGIVSGSYRLF